MQFASVVAHPQPPAPPPSPGAPCDVCPSTFPAPATRARACLLLRPGPHCPSLLLRTLHVLVFAGVSLVRVRSRGCVRLQAHHVRAVRASRPPSHTPPPPTPTLPPLPRAPQVAVLLCCVAGVGFGVLAAALAPISADGLAGVGFWPLVVLVGAAGGVRGGVDPLFFEMAAAVVQDKQVCVMACVGVGMGVYAGSTRA